jgi:hypothetical protein
MARDPRATMIALQKTQAVHWSVTWNNPPADAEERCARLVNDETLTHVIAGREIGEEGTPHLQMHLTTSRRLRWDQVRALLPGIFAAATYSTPANAINYCRKTGNYFEYGESPVAAVQAANEARGARQTNIWEEAVALVNAGKFDQLSPQMQIRHGGILQRMAAQANQAPNNAVQDQIVGVWIHGRPGFGKSFAAKQVYAEYYLGTPTDNKAFRWMDGYNQETVMLFDEMTEDIARNSYQWLLNLTDGTTSKFELKGTGSIRVCPAIVMITSNKSIADIWARGTVEHEAVSRRFLEIAYTTKYQYDGEALRELIEKRPKITHPPIRKQPAPAPPRKWDSTADSAVAHVRDQRENRAAVRREEAENQQALLQALPPSNVFAIGGHRVVRMAEDIAHTRPVHAAVADPAAAGQDPGGISRTRQERPREWGAEPEHVRREAPLVRGGGLLPRIATGRTVNVSQQEFDAFFDDAPPVAPARGTGQGSVYGLDGRLEDDGRQRAGLLLRPASVTSTGMPAPDMRGGQMWRHPGQPQYWGDNEESDDSHLVLAARSRPGDKRPRESALDSSGLLLQSSDGSAANGVARGVLEMPWTAGGPGGLYGGLLAHGQRLELSRSASTDAGEELQDAAPTLLVNQVSGGSPNIFEEDLDLVAPTQLHWSDVGRDSADLREAQTPLRDVTPESLESSSLATGDIYMSGDDESPPISSEDGSPPLFTQRF